ncbi:dATP/dGTP pyrophosphohydrolase domain-containing protein [Tuwongella immobilis]|uniref:dATP/dGTP diphosphohydrolase MazZ domain-containing protein n=1 Tax=Tuwongella immobilis TaxID=692036 RepID=A0A6C2YPZ7_9BACT|nr:dATP/dGTP pyrophosphohydrolase domain-containing protein [Tuwongella immobilis]VIP03095.1 Eaa prophage protein OS=Citrobacter amalonaticus GN=DQ02_13720 PE=4 SV=1: DUF550 [Tuwongella immobilis]VTS03372.1 Eaa prophage protein OS=Citrobacter amalonaticus GN=DQ02_13720 PE=4 SV=1: DUF550 [Tuwongella immobilis]
MSEQIRIKRDFIRSNDGLIEMPKETSGFINAILSVAQFRGSITSEIWGHLHACLLDASWEWSQKTFGSVEYRGPKGPLLHLEKEVREAVQAIGTPELAEELADCQLLIWDAARRAGLGPVELLMEVWKKLQKNQKRHWPKPTTDQPVEHLREDSK